MKWIEELIKLRNELYEDLPKGEISSWELLSLIKLHINDLDSLIHRNSATLPSSSVTGEKTGKTKEQCLKDRDVSIDRWPDTRDLIYLAMDDYAKQFVTGESEAIGFAEWMGENIDGHYYINNESVWEMDGHKLMNSKELYNLYKQSK